VANSEPGPPSLHAPPPAWRQLFMQIMTGGAGGGRKGRTPQSTQSVPYAQVGNSEPGPPSSQSASDAQLHVFVQVPRVLGGGGGELGGEGGRIGRTPQSAQSVPYWQSGYSAPGPPSSQKPSDA